MLLIHQYKSYFGKRIVFDSHRLIRSPVHVNTEPFEPMGKTEGYDLDVPIDGAKTEARPQRGSLNINAIANIVHA